MKPRMIVFNSSKVPGPLGFLFWALGLVLLAAVTTVGLAVAVFAGVFLLATRALSALGLGAPSAPRQTRAQAKKSESIVVEDANGNPIATVPRYSS